MPQGSAASLPARSAPRRLFDFLREAVSGSDRDFTEGPLSSAILLLAIPMVVEMVMESAFALIDVFFVSRLGAEAVATVGLTEAVLTLVFAIAIGLSMATTAVISRRIGEKDPEAAAVSAVQAIYVGLAVSVLVAVVGIFFAADILRLMGASPAVVEVGHGYTSVLLGGAATVVLLFLNNAIFRGAGDAAIAMRVLIVANSINIVLDPCFIFGLGPFPEMGVAGAAVATTIGRGVGVVWQFWLLAKGTDRLRIAARHVRLRLPVVARLLRVSAGGIAQFLIATCSWVVLVRLVALFGDTAVAGYTIAVRIVMVSILPAWGLCNAAATLVGQNLGAAKPDRAEAAVWRTGFYNAVFMGSLGLCFLVFGPQLIGVFTADPAVLAVGADCLRIFSYGYVFYAYGLVMVQAFNGAGDTFTPTVINFFCYWAFQIPLAYFLARSTGLDHRGVFWAIAVAESLIAVVGVWWFRRGRWKERTV